MQGQAVKSSLYALRGDSLTNLTELWSAQIDWTHPAGHGSRLKVKAAQEL